MEKCFITKLNGIVSSPDILKLGEMRINVTKLNNPTSKTQYFSFTFNEKSDIEIIGDGYFTNENLSENYGKKKTVEPNTDTIIYVSNGDFGLSISDKYSLKNIVVFTLNYSISNKKMSDIEVLKFSKNLVNLNLPNTQVSGDIGGLKTLTALTSLSLYNTQVPCTGNIGELSALSKCTEILIKYSKLCLLYTSDAADDSALV